MTEIGRAPQVTTRDEYDLADALGDPRIQSIPAGSNLLLCGPTMTGKSDLAFQALYGGFSAGNPVIAVLSNDPPRQMADFFQQRGVPDGTPVRVVDCSGRQSPDEFPSWLSVSAVSSPGDLTGIGIEIAKAMHDLGSEAEDGLYVGLSSLSTLLQYANERRVFNFAHVMTGRIAAGGYLGAWTLDTDAHPQSTVNTLKGIFRYVAEVDEQPDGQRELRVLGGPSEWRTWKPI